jgi:hypothetical protein
MEGQHHKKKTRSQVTKQMYDLMNTMRGDDGKKQKNNNNIFSSKIRNQLRNVVTRARTKTKAATDMTNEEYERHLLNRTEKDFIHARNKVASRLKRIVRRRREKEDEARMKEPPIYIYGSQKLSSVASQMERLRNEIAKDNTATYTYSRDFAGATLAPINPADVKAREKLERRKRFLVPKGFVWPAPRDPSEYNKHPKRPSEAEIQELRMPWKEPDADASERRGAPAYLDPLVRTSEGFDTTPILGGRLFGMLLDGGVEDPEYWKSVHLCGEGLAMEQAQARERELKEWKDKVVVENIHFVPHITQKRTNQIDRYNGLLKSLPSKQYLRSLRKGMKRCRVKNHGKLEALPISAFNKGKFVERGNFMKTIEKSDDVSKMVGEKAFQSVTSRLNGCLLPRISKAVSKRRIPKISGLERNGRVWG